VAPGRADLLASAMSRLLADPRRRREMGEMGGEPPAERFAAERMIDATAAVYADVLARARR
jgi:glycosyltransferase involved in cell wall biosynthesis